MEAIITSKREAIQYGYGTFYQSLQTLVDRPVLDLDGHYLSVSLGESIEPHVFPRLPKNLLYLEANSDGEIVAFYPEKDMRDSK